MSSWEHFLGLGNFFHGIGSPPGITDYPAKRGQPSRIRAFDDTRSHTTITRYTLDIVTLSYVIYTPFLAGVF